MGNGYFFMKLRKYQQESIENLAISLKKDNRIILIAPTASGKSVIIAAIVDRFLKKNKQDVGLSNKKIRQTDTHDKRVLVVCHQSHLLEQNYSQIKKINKNASVGLFCAGLNKKQTEEKIILASRDSLGANPKIVGDFELIIVDEAHLVSCRAHKIKKETDSIESNYAKIFQNIKHKYVIGMTGTPWRGKNTLIFGKDKFFKSVGYKIEMKDLIEQGYLTPYVFPKKKHILIDCENLKASSKTGMFRTAQLEKISNKQKIIKSCIEIWLSQTKNRKCSIFFCVSRKHAALIFEEISQKIGDEKVVYVDALTKNRTQVLEKIKNGQYKAVVNVDVLTTGFDAPIIDCIVWLRPTHSPALFVQMAGRGLRIFPDKKNCLMLDFAGNFTRFDSLENPFIVCFDENNKQSNVRNEEPQKTGLLPFDCEKCGTVAKPRSKSCGYCGNVFSTNLLESYNIQNIWIVRNFHLSPAAVIKNNRKKYILTMECFNQYFCKNETIRQHLFVDHKFPSQITKVVYWKIKNGRFPHEISKTRQRKNPHFFDISILSWREKKDFFCDHDFKKKIPRLNLGICSFCGLEKIIK